MELEFFCKPGTDLEWFAYWKDCCVSFLKSLGIRDESLRLRDHDREELSHYSNATTDIEFLFPFGWGELWGIADRTDFDLKQHMEHSGEDLSYRDPETNEKYVPYCIEPSLGADRVTLAFLLDAYREEALTDEKSTDDARTVLRFHPALAPYKAAVLPLTKKQAERAERVHKELASHFFTDYDASGNIGKRYRRQDEIGTPFCITVDFDTETDDTVTLRDRDSMGQIRLPIGGLREYIEEKMRF
jgi:glycyl-tRNA synthetase